LQRAFCENFAGIITHPITHAEPKGLKQKGGESLRDYYRCFGELGAQVHDITEREVIEAFSHGIMAKWQFQDFCKENPRNNKEFRCVVQKVIMVEEKMRERFSDRNNQENNRGNSDRRNFSNIGHPERKRGPDNTVAMADKMKKFSKFRRFEDIENMHCIWHPQGNHTIGDYRIFIDRYARKGKIRKKR
jgi:hypothetical protein